MMTEVEIRVNQLLLAQDQTIKVARSYYQYQDDYGLPPIELCQEFKKYQEAEVFCDRCPPSLIMIPSPTCYERDKDFWPNYFRVEHNVRGIRSINYPFEGVRGAYYPFQFKDERQHLDIVEMDNASYFKSLSDKEKINFMKRFFDALQINKLSRSSYVGLSSDIKGRTHVTLHREAYVGFAGRNAPDFNLKLDKIAAINHPPYRLYGRGYP